eukprot:superscaffoldBa00000018_g357
MGNGNRFTDQDVCNKTCAGIHVDGEDPEEDEPDTPIAIICGVLLAVIVVSIFVTVIVLTLKSNSALMGDRQRKRKLQESPAPDNKMLKDNDGVALGATGLRNLGNTCFMNAILQSLRGYQQQDAHEFMRYLLDHLHRELQYSRNGAAHPVSPQDGVRLSTAEGKCCINGTASVVTSNFGGILQNEVNCLICGTESRKFDPFLDLSLDIPSQFRQKRSKDQEPGPTCTLRDCLRSFTDLEELDETELYYCHKCRKRQKSTKKFWIQKLPKVLCLHLKRFHWTAFLRNKVDTYVEFPLKGLDMKGYLLEPENSLPESCLYDLVAVVVHHGSGVGSGHYTAYGSHEGRWYHFNDSTVTLTNEDTVRKAKAYILFYVERTDQVASDKTATNSTAAVTVKPAVDAAAADTVSSEVVAQDKVASDPMATDSVLMDVAAPDNAALENVGKAMVALDEAGTERIGSVNAATDRDTSDTAATEDASQAIQAAAQ